MVAGEVVVVGRVRHPRGVHGVRSWMRAGIHFESYHYDPGPRSVVDAHAHDHYQWCLSVDHDGLYDYRRERYAVPATAVSVIHPGEPHACGDPEDRERPSTYLVANIPPPAVATAAEGVLDGPDSAPFFGSTVTLDPGVRSAFVRLHRASITARDRLALDAALLDLVERALAVMTSDLVDLDRPGRERRAVAAAVDHLRANATGAVPMSELAAVSGLSQRHLYRTFKEETGVAPHRYQLHLRVDRAKAALAAGQPAATVAASCGFADQAHLARHFKRYVGFPPGRYRPAAPG